MFITSAIKAGDTLAPIDVIMPTHDHLELTIDSIKALYANTVVPFHLIIVDDSTDNITPHYFHLLQETGVSQIPKKDNITFIHSDVPYKCGNQFFNVALSHCKYDYVATVMNSTRVEPEWEIIAIKMFMDNPRLGIIGLKSLFPNGNIIESAGIKFINGYKPIDIGKGLPSHRYTSFYECDAVQWAFALLRKEAVVGNLDENLYHGFVGWDDVDNCFAVRKKGWQVIYCGHGVGYHEPRATRGSDDPETARKNKENAVTFWKRWGMYEAYVKDNAPKIQERNTWKNIKHK